LHTDDLLNLRISQVSFDRKYIEESDDYIFGYYAIIVDIYIYNFNLYLQY